MCSADALGIRERITGGPWIHFFNGYFVVYLLFKPNDLCFVKNNSGNFIIDKASYSQIMRSRTTHNINIYSKLFISEIHIFNFGFMTSRHEFLREQEYENVWFISKPKDSASKNAWRTQA
jgi:hypothetical protein